MTAIGRMNRPIWFENTRRDSASNGVIVGCHPLALNSARMSETVPFRTEAGDHVRILGFETFGHDV